MADAWMRDGRIGLANELARRVVETRFEELPSLRGCAGLPETSADTGSAAAG